MARRRMPKAQVNTEGRSKREVRMARKEAAMRAQARQARLRRLRNAAIGVLAVIGLGFGAWLVFRPAPELAGVERPPDRGRDHVANATYASSTPTSGAHDARAPRCGTYRDGLALPLAVHALEHGAVVLWYDADRPELADALEASTAGVGSHLIIAANPELDSPVVATAWNRRASYTDDAPEITEFVDTYRRRGPERVDCDR